MRMQREGLESPSQKSLAVGTTSGLLSAVKLSQPRASAAAASPQAETRRGLPRVLPQRPQRCRGNSTRHSRGAVRPGALNLQKAALEKRASQGLSLRARGWSCGSLSQTRAKPPQRALSAALPRPALAQERGRPSSSWGHGPTCGAAGSACSPLQASASHSWWPPLVASPGSLLSNLVCHRSAGHQGQPTWRGWWQVSTSVHLLLRLSRGSLPRF